MAGNFDRVAGWYDGLARLAFGRAQQRASARFLDQLPAQGQVLILGGGSGALLLSLRRQRPGLTIWYVEASARMLAKARHRLQQAQLDARIHWLHGDETILPPDQRFVGLITPFVLDLYRPSALRALMHRLDQHLHPSGIWLHSDFHLPGGWRNLPFRALLSLMYALFRWTAGLQARHLPPMTQTFNQLGYQQARRQTYWGGFILSEVRLKKS